MKIENNKVILSKDEITKTPKKITGTRFGAILEKNKYQTPFKAWCEITKTWQEDFEDTKYTIAGKIIEPKQAQYLKDIYQLNVISPSDVFGVNYFNDTRGDFFSFDPIFGGMWDYLINNDDSKLEAVVECKTSSRPQDWLNDNIPEYYKLQAALYAYLLNVDLVYMLVSFLDDKDYIKPNNFECNGLNTKIIPFKVSEEYPEFEKYIDVLKTWYELHVLEGKSPEFNEDLDKDILKDLRTKIVDLTNDLFIQEYEDLLDKIKEIDESKKEYEDRLKTIKEEIKNLAISNMGDNNTKYQITGSRYIITTSKTYRDEVDKKKLIEDGLADKYISKKETYTTTNKEIKK